MPREKGLSRLDNVIRRLKAQRACLNAARDMIAGLPGPVIELGLGNGRTYDHLRETMPDREIFVFERQPAAHPSCMPDAGHLIVGDLRDTLPQALTILPGPAALVHADLGSADPELDAALSRWLSGLLPGIIRDQAIVASDQALDSASFLRLPLPAHLPMDRYFLYRHCK